MPYHFPDETNLPRAKSDPNEPIYHAGGAGNNRIFYTLRTTAGQHGSPRWDFYLINIYTLARNAFAPGMRYVDFETLIDHDADLYMTFIGAYMAFRRATPATVLFYAPSYAAIPPEMARQHTGRRLELDAYYAELYRKIPTKLTEQTEDPHIRKFLIGTGPQQLPHKQLARIITDYSHAGGARNWSRLVMLMVSHCPVDLHLARVFPQLNLMESFTAQVLKPAEFGRKLIKDVSIPFNPLTHRVFGDDVHIEPFVRMKQRTDLIQRADQQRWAVQTENTIGNDIRQAVPTFTNQIASQAQSIFGI